uniref:Ubiquitin-like protein ATG12 n=2 Tax=Phocoena sinus TaxID=42100 RepID=A0A8C9B098_PHOSS
SWLSRADRVGAGGQGGGGRASLASGSRWRSFPTRPLPHTRAPARPGAAGQGLDRAGPGRGRRGGKRKQLQAGARSIGALALPAAHGDVAYRPFPETCCWGGGETVVDLSAVRGLQQVRRRGPTCNSDSQWWFGFSPPLLRHLPSAALRRKARPLYARIHHFRPHLPPSKMAEEPESLLQLPPSIAAEGEGPTEVSPETATPEPPSSAAVSPGTEEPAGDTKKKIDILLKAVGDTPIMKTKKWAVERTRTIQGLIDFIKKFLKLVASEQLFIYVNQSFAPSPDQEVGTLYECFGSDGKLVLHYCKSQAWG